MDKKLIHYDEVDKFILDLNNYTNNHKYEEMYFEDEDFDYDEYLDYINNGGQEYIKAKYNINVKLNLYGDGYLEVKYNKEDENIIDKIFN